jgi:hypothetical protein
VMSSACLGRLYIWGELRKARRRRSLLGLYYVLTGNEKNNRYYILALAITWSTSLLIPCCVVATFSLVDT